MRIDSGISSPPCRTTPATSASSATGRDPVGPFVYVRFHGATSKYGGGYSRERLSGWAEWLNAQRGAGRDVYAYFNNDVGGHAPRDAVTLRRLMEE